MQYDFEYEDWSTSGGKIIFKKRGTVRETASYRISAEDILTISSSSDTEKIPNGWYKRGRETPVPGGDGIEH